MREIRVFGDRSDGMVTAEPSATRRLRWLPFGDPSQGAPLAQGASPVARMKALSMQGDS
jgi:hypothetical protein